MSLVEDEERQDEIEMDQVRENHYWSPNKEEKHQEEETLNITIEDDERLFTYDVYENPNPALCLFFALQQVLMSLSRSMSTSLLIADILCARENEYFKARLLSTTMFMSGLCTLLQNTIGIRLPLYQGPSATYVTPLLAMSMLDTWKCPEQSSVLETASNISSNASSFDVDAENVLYTKVQKLEGSLMIAGALHMLVGLTGIVGFLLRFIGPITVVPALTIIALYIYRATVKFAKAQWGITVLTVSIAVILSFYMRKMTTPIPAWSRSKGFHIKFFPLHKVFSFVNKKTRNSEIQIQVREKVRSVPTPQPPPFVTPTKTSNGRFLLDEIDKVLIATVVGWTVSAILTSAGAFSDDPKSDEFYARTDSRLYIIRETNWFIFPYPGQFGPPGYDTGALVTFIMGTISSVIDSVGDYYACAKVCEAPPPPKQAVNRGIAVEGFMSFFAGWAGAGHATSTFGGNIGAIGFTRVASLRVFQVVGLLFIIFGVVGKIGAVFVTIPYSVVAGMQIINFGVLIGVMLSNLQFIDLKSTRNMAIIGISMLFALMMPHWLETTDDVINTGNEQADNTIQMFLANPAFIAGFLACFLDNTIPGTLAERGILAWQAEMGLQDEESKENTIKTIRAQKVAKTVYVVPYIGKILRKLKCCRYIPICPKYS